MNVALGTIDTELARADLTKLDKLNLLLKRGFYTIPLRSSGGVAEAINGSNIYFTRVLKESSTEKELYFMERQQALFGLLYNFTTNCFPNYTGWIPQKYKESYPDQQVITAKDKQQKVFRSILQMYTSKDIVGPFLEKDKFFLSLRMFATAVYASSYKETMPKEELSSLMALLTSDLAAFDVAEKRIFKNAENTDYITAYQHAFAYDIVHSIGTSTYSNEAIDKNYALAREKLEQSTSADKISLGMSGMLNDTYQLASMQRRFGDRTQQQKDYKKVAASLQKNILTSPETKDITKAFYNYGKSEFGDWYQLKYYLFKALENDKDLKSTVLSIGVSI
jgi:hypothetical protein